jgi:hypothetical protein
VAAPAIGLMVAGGVSAAFTVLGLLLLVIVGTAAIADPEVRDALPSFAVILAFALLKLVLDGLTIYAGWQMRQLRSWTLCMAGSIAAMLPCSACCILGLPIGIWALVVLIDNEVKQRFDGGYTPPPSGGYGDPGGYTPPPSGNTPPPPGDYTPPPPPGGYSPPPPGGYNPPPTGGSGGPTERG